MLSAVNANSQERLDELALCLKKTKECSVVATLRQLAESANGEVQSVDIQSVATEAQNLINVEGDLVYAEISEKNGSITDIKRIRAMWQAFLNRGTVRFLKGEANDYCITIDLIKSELEDSKAYCLSFFNPEFMAGEDHGISLATRFEDFNFGIEDVTLSEIEYEEEQLQAANGKSGNGYESQSYTEMDEEEYDDDDDEDENDEFTSRDDVISNDDLISPVKD